MAAKKNKIQKAAEHCSLNLYGHIEGDYVMPYRDGAKWAIKYCNQVIREVLKHYEFPAIVDCIMADYEEIVSSQND